MFIKSLNALTMIAAWVVLAVWFPDETRNLFRPEVLYKIGPFVYVIVPIGLYLLYRGVSVFHFRKGYREDEKRAQLNYMVEWGNSAARYGLLGTVLFMIVYFDSSAPDIKLFFEALFSTFVGTSIQQATRDFKNLMMPLSIKPVSEVIKTGEVHDEKSRREQAIA